MHRRENTLKKYLFEKMGTRWSAQSHEDSLSDGIPDISYGMSGINGWIELKQIERWPVKAETLVKPKHYTPEQVNWLVDRGNKGGHCFVIVKVHCHIFIFGHHVARDIRSGMSRDDYFVRSYRQWNTSIDINELCDVLIRGY